ncbi:hypothetical protein HYT23_01565 [Candidatus Pacearchaeota archaeon]|nr:hypothetical protein [Candidatus Pacearchaeota archaeon]
MKNLRIFSILIVTSLVFYLLRVFIGSPAANENTINLLLTISSIMFGVLVGFFISQLWTRYTEIREHQGVRSSEGVNMIQYASHFFKNKGFEKEFKKLVEKSCIADEAIRWDEGHFEISYYRDIEKSFNKAKPKSSKDLEYFDNLLDSYNAFVASMVKMDTLYKERLFLSQWLMLIGLSVVMFISVLLLNASNFLEQAIVIIFPPIISLALTIIYDLDRLLWGRESVTLEPNQRILEAIGAKRFYLKKNIKFVGKHIKGYRTEDDLSGELKRVYTDILNKRKLESQD